MTVNHSGEDADVSHIGQKHVGILELVEISLPCGRTLFFNIRLGCRINVRRILGIVSQK
jgi:hypothetical protein